MKLTNDTDDIDDTKNNSLLLGFQTLIWISDWNRVWNSAIPSCSNVTVRVMVSLDSTYQGHYNI